MSDFSSLCPLFNTGVYSELTLPVRIPTSVTSATTRVGGILFGRSVIVTHAYVAKKTANTSTTASLTVKLYRAASFAAANTVFASLKISKTVTTYPLDRFSAMTVTAKTFSATQWLIVRYTKATATARAIHPIVIRYKEK
uniref:Uncharacterized protein n=1 Tax=viral metagenome TaxID=1070528 RepID=A0A6H1ZXE7_9ZZZZ